MATNTKTTDYQLHLKGFVGGYDFDADYVDYILIRIRKARSTCSLIPSADVPTRLSASSQPSSATAMSTCISWA